MYLQQLFAQKLETVSHQKIAQALGYRNAENVSFKLNKLLSSPYLGLEDSNYDFKYSNDEFIIKLAQVLDIPSKLVEVIVEEMKAELLEQTQKFKSYIFVETFFRREDQPIFALAAMEGTRHIIIKKEIRYLNLDRQLSEVSTLIQHHFKKNKGTLPLWGPISKYVFFYEDNLVIELSPDGNIITSSENYSRSKATLRL